MSKKKTMIEVCPGKLYPGGPMRELLMSSGHTCSYCHGNGYFWGHDELGHPEKSDCPVCGGSGELTAMVTVEWKKVKE